MKYSLAFSTCPNDTFIFDAIVNGRIAIGNWLFEVHLADIQELNQLALHSEVDVVKISFALYPLISNKYQLLTAGAALGKGVGPLIISKRKIYPDEVPHARIAIPGEHTTANMLLTLAHPAASQKYPYLFSSIEDAILGDEVDAGVIIHENRFTYQKKGLKKIQDLGDYWEKLTGMPIPLGGIAIRRDLHDDTKSMANALVRRSVEFALANPNASDGYVRSNAQTMEPEVMKNHIALYVNKFTVDVGKVGINAVSTLFDRCIDIGYCQTADIVQPIFVE